MDFSRRGFLNLLGVAGVATAARPAISLFGADNEKGIIVPDSALTSGHFVVKPKRFLERVPEDLRIKDPSSDHIIVGRIVRHRTPRQPLLMREGSLVSSPVTYLEGMSIRDAHTAFYLASHELREKFTVFTHGTLQQVSASLRPMATLVTIVDAPIHARPTNLYKASWDNEERGFDVVATFRQFVVLGARQSEISTYEHYSNRGEYPIDVPRDVEMGILIRMDREVVAAVETQTSRVAKLLSHFNRTWQTG